MVVPQSASAQQSPGTHFPSQHFTPVVPHWVSLSQAVHCRAMHGPPPQSLLTGLSQQVAVAHLPSQHFSPALHCESPVQTPHL